MINNWCITYKDDLSNITAWNLDDKTIILECSGIRPVIDIMRVVSGSYDIIPGGQRGTRGLNILPENRDPAKPVKIQIKIVEE